MRYENKALRDLCRDAPCICCGAADGTVVPAHRNEGKGMGLKTSDATCIPLCHACHAVYDSSGLPLNQKRAMYESLYAKWAPIVIERLADVPRGTARRVKAVERPAYRPPSKRVPHPGVIGP